MDEDTIKSLVTRLSRPHPSGGVVIERAAILADGGDFPAVMDWIVAHSGKADGGGASATPRGLHGPRMNDTNPTISPTPLRFVLPTGALD
jgi:hypothetical protein